MGRTPVEAWPLARGERIAAADVGVETALADLRARTYGVPLARWLADQAGLPAYAPTPIPVNALLGAGSPDDLAREATSAAACGFRAVKVKVGRDVADDGDRLGAVRAALGPEAELRIDANGAWNEQEAVAALATHAVHGVALCEQPVMRRVPTPSRVWRAFVRRAPSPSPLTSPAPPWQTFGPSLLTKTRSMSLSSSRCGRDWRRRSQ